jgi:hypothetical protein
VKIVALRPTDRERERERLAATPRTSHPLLEVETLRWHVGLKNGLRRANVDSDLHRRRCRQKVDLSASLSLRVFRDGCRTSHFVVVELVVWLFVAGFPGRHEDTLELALPSGWVRCLSSEFFAMETKTALPPHRRRTLPGHSSRAA